MRTTRTGRHVGVYEHRILAAAVLTIDILCFPLPSRGREGLPRVCAALPEPRRCYDLVSCGRMFASR
ncbi:hypothetical protein E2C01_003534 [Portunus trituberculatus]|uniref:Uncharacterized protein n=1 Tax=Portunus trituberculatus TaxID=210409 RepID=A0A5B7CN17_PORTR|nr:hypothetical protein [Portunus trituberculatus]